MSDTTTRKKGEGFATLCSERILGRLSLNDIAKLSGEQKASCHYAENYSHHIVPRIVYNYAKALSLDPKELMAKVANEAIEREIFKQGELPIPKKPRKRQRKQVEQASE